MTKPRVYLRNPSYNHLLWLTYAMNQTALNCWDLAKRMEMNIFQLDRDQLVLSQKQQKILENELSDDTVNRLRRRFSEPRPTFWQSLLGEFYDGIANETTPRRKS